MDSAGVELVSLFGDIRRDSTSDIVYTVHDDVHIIVENNTAYFAIFSTDSQIADEQTLLIPPLSGETIMVGNIPFMETIASCRLPSLDGVYYEGKARIYSVPLDTLVHLIAGRTARTFDLTCRRPLLELLDRL